MLTQAEKLGVLVALIGWPWPFLWCVEQVLRYCDSGSQCGGNEDWLFLAAFCTSVVLSVGVGYGIARVDGALRERA